MGTKQLPHEHMFSLDQEEAVVEELQGNRDELQRTRRNLESPNVDMRSKKGNAYSHKSSAESRRRSLDRFQLMQRPKSTEVRRSLTAAELKQ